jgi:uncharacterized circularly permuted ATP-grasp superfamily protein
MGFWRRFQEHPRSVGETYFEHALHATRFGFSMLRGALACWVHAAFPWICTTTGSQTVVRLHARMVVNRSKNRLDEMRPLDPLDSLAEHI